jgi:hypothetical protein
MAAKPNLKSTTSTRALRSATIDAAKIDTGAARKLLENTYMPKGAGATPAVLAAALYKLAAESGKDDGATKKVVVAVATLLEGAVATSMMQAAYKEAQEHIAKLLGDFKEEVGVISGGMEETHARLESLTEELGNFREMLNASTLEMKGEMSALARELRETKRGRESASASHPPLAQRGHEEGEILTNEIQPDHPRDGARQQGDDRAQPHSYAMAAAMAAQITRPEHQRSINRAANIEKQILIRKAAGTQEDQLSKLTEAQLLQKAEIAIEQMGEAAGDRPGNMRIMGVKRLRGGDVVVQVEPEEGGRWLRKPEVLKLFESRFSGTSEACARVHMVIVEHLPTAADITQPRILREVESRNGLPPDSLRYAQWLKRPNHRAPGQLHAHAEIGCDSRETANTIIAKGLTVFGKMTTGRKPKPEPSRCLRCQKLNRGHRAADCGQKESTCARCAGNHNTAACMASELACANCKASGHGAADRRCPVFLEKAKIMAERNPDSRYEFYPTNEPWTWTRHGDVTTNQIVLHPPPPPIPMREERHPPPLRAVNQEPRPPSRPRAFRQPPAWKETTRGRGTTSKARGSVSRGRSTTRAAAREVSASDGMRQTDIRRGFSTARVFRDELQEQGMNTDDWAELVAEADKNIQIPLEYAPPTLSPPSSHRREAEGRRRSASEGHQTSA